MMDWSCAAPFLALDGLISPVTTEVGERDLLGGTSFEDFSDLLEEIRDEQRIASTASRCFFLFEIKFSEVPT